MNVLHALGWGILAWLTSVILVAIPFSQLPEREWERSYITARIISGIIAVSIFLLTV